MAADSKMLRLFRWMLLFFLNMATLPGVIYAELQHDQPVNAPKSDKKTHAIDSVELLMFMGLLIATILSIWVIKHFRLRFIHETGLSIIYGVIVGAAVTYLSKDTQSYDSIYSLVVDKTDDTNLTDNALLQIVSHNNDTLREYTCKKKATTLLGSKMVFDPEIFFYVLLPPIIFNAGYSMKRRHFFKNFGAIVTFAFFGTIISTFTIGGILYGVVEGIRPIAMENSTEPHFTFQECVWYGCIISATDPVTVLAIFHDLNVDVDLYALVFGESVLNDAVAITLANAIDQGDKGHPSVGTVFATIGMFLAIFIGSFLIGMLVGSINAIMTKFTKIKEFPLMESTLMVLMSYTSYLTAEALSMSGIVSVLFCGIFQAHYTFNNLSEESKKSTKQVIQLLNFVSENFVFLYIGVSVFTRRFQATEWNPWFIGGAFIAMIISRAVNIYPLSFILNLGRRNKIPFNFQHMMMFSGLRGAIAFALAVKKAAEGTPQVNTFLTTTIIMVVLTVIGCGALTLTMLQCLKIRVGVDEGHDTHTQSFAPPHEAGETITGDVRGPVGGSNDLAVSGVSTATPKAERARMVKIWNQLDNAVFKPILTNYRVTLAENFPNSRFCGLLSRLTTTAQQFENCARQTVGDDDDDDSDIDMLLDDDELTLNHPSTPTPNVFSVEEDDDPGDLGVPLDAKDGAPMLAFM